MGKLIDLTGQRFGRLVVIEKAETNKYRAVLWRCQCDCGRVKTARGIDLRRGKVKSCGCLQRETTPPDISTHGQRFTRLYRIWLGMKARCNIPSSTSFVYYGARGIAVCAEWSDSFETFRDWAMSHGYQDDLTIDRIDNDKGYNPDNCRWVTMKEQNSNRRPHKKKN